MIEKKFLLLYPHFNMAIPLCVICIPRAYLHGGVRFLFKLQLHRERNA